MAQKTLILFAHPRFEMSRANHALLSAVSDLDGVTVHDLYETYPGFDIDVAREKHLLETHGLVVWQHPFYWYSAPPLLKQWIDMVLEFGWAYGPGGNALKGKTVFNAISAGGAREAYGQAGRHRFSVRQLLAPFEQTASLCQMHYLPPFSVMGTHKLGTAELQAYAQQYVAVLKNLMEGRLSPETLNRHAFLNDVPAGAWTE